MLFRVLFQKDRFLVFNKGCPTEDRALLIRVVVILAIFKVSATVLCDTIARQRQLGVPALAIITDYVSLLVIGCCRNVNTLLFRNLQGVVSTEVSKGI